jgi:molybdopterin converting factor subunit 1
MTVTVLYFAAVRDLVGTDEETMTVPDGSDIEAFARLLAEARPALAGKLGAVRFARNETFATNDERLADGDVVALIPPVAGG